MFLIDDILLSPMKAIAAIGRQVQETARKDMEDQEKAILNSLSELHQSLESNSISVEQFDERETSLLDRLEAIQNMLGTDSETEEDE